jgi:hypothetical protein
MNRATIRWPLRHFCQKEAIRADNAPSRTAAQARLVFPKFVAPRRAPAARRPLATGWARPGCRTRGALEAPAAWRCPWRHSHHWAPPGTFRGVATILPDRAACRAAIPSRPREVAAPAAICHDFARSSAGGNVACECPLRLHRCQPEPSVPTLPVAHASGLTLPVFHWPNAEAVQALRLTACRKKTVADTSRRRSGTAKPPLPCLSACAAITPVPRHGNPTNGPEGGEEAATRESSVTRSLFFSDARTR